MTLNLKSINIFKLTICKFLISTKANSFGTNYVHLIPKK